MISEESISEIYSTVRNNTSVCSFVPFPTQTPSERDMRNTVNEEIIRPIKNVASIAIVDLASCDASVTEDDREEQKQPKQPKPKDFGKATPIVHVQSSAITLNRTKQPNQRKGPRETVPKVDHQPLLNLYLKKRASRGTNHENTRTTDISLQIREAIPETSKTMDKSVRNSFTIFKADRSVSKNRDKRPKLEENLTTNILR